MNTERGEKDLMRDDEWNGLADLLANLIEKYACEMDLDALPDPDRHYKTKQIGEMYKRFMQLRKRQTKRQCIRT